MSEEKKKVTAKKAVKKPRIPKIKKEENPKSMELKASENTVVEGVKLEEKPAVKKEKTLSKKELLANFDWGKASNFFSIHTCNICFCTLKLNSINF